jgi:hypothetical protein
VLLQVVVEIYDLKSPPELVQAMLACSEAICPCLLLGGVGWEGKGRDGMGWAIYENNAKQANTAARLPPTLELRTVNL